MARSSILRRHAALLAVGVLGLAAGTAVASDAGQAAAQEVTQSNYVDLMDNWLYTHDGHNRGFGVQHDLARDNIQTLFENYGWSVELHPFNYFGTTYYNVVATRMGVTYPNQEYIVGAHYDSVDNPGADDNASGTALILEAARVLGQYESDYTIRLIAFDREEQGLYGSSAYANQHIGDDILGMISCDMVAYDANTNAALTYARDTWLIDSLNQALWDYGGITQNFGGWNGQSDHASFDSTGVDSALLIENLVWSNPYYHTQNDSFDTPGYLDFEYATNMTRAIVGWLVDQAGVQVDVNTLDFVFPNGQPEWVSPQGGTTMRVEVAGVGDEIPVPGTGLLHYDLGGGWQSVAMSVVDVNLYDAVFPSADCGANVKYYLSAQGVSGDTYTDPYSAPDAFFEALAVNDIIIFWEDNFETDTGWTAENLGASSGYWQRGVPVDDSGWDYDPASDSDGSGQCYLTQNQFGNTDVDDGAVRLTSPVFDMSEGGSIAYDYYLYLTDSDGRDRLLVEASNNGASWSEVTRHDTSGGTSWRSHVITEADLLDAGVTPGPTMQVRFTANDADTQSIVEAGLDAFQILQYDCGADCPEDLDGDGFVGQSDLGVLLSAYGDNGGGDIDGDGDTDQADLGALLGAYGSDCP